MQPQTDGQRWVLIPRLPLRGNKKLMNVEKYIHKTVHSVVKILEPTPQIPLFEFHCLLSNNLHMPGCCGTFGYLMTIACHFVAPVGLNHEAICWRVCNSRADLLFMSSMFKFIVVVIDLIATHHSLF